MTGALRRDLALFLGYRFLSTSYLFAPVLVLFFGARGLSVVEITLLNSVYCVTAMLFEVPTGLLADRWGRKRAMVLGSLMMAAGCLVDWAGHSFASFAVGEGLLALGMTLTSGSDSAWLYDRLRDDGRVPAYRRLEGLGSASKLAGTAVAMAAGGWLARSHLAATYLATAAVCLAASLAAALLGEARYERPSRRAPLAQTLGAVRLVASYPPLRFAVLFSTLVFSLTRMSIYVHQPYLSAAGFAISDVGVVLAALSLLGGLGAVGIDPLRRTLGERTLVWALPALLAASYLVLGTWVVAVSGVAMLALQSIAGGVYSPLSKDLLNRSISDSSHRATILSVESMARRLAFGLFAPAVGATIDARGLGAGMEACAGLAIVGTAALAGYIAGRRGALSTGFEGERTPTPVPVAPVEEEAPEAVRAVE